MFKLEQPCPNCSRPFVPWRAWAITRWSCIACPACGVALSRHLDWRVFLLIIVSAPLGATIPLAVYALPLSLPVKRLVALACLIVFLILFWLIEVLTVRLVVAGEKRGRFGYKQ